MPWAGTSYHCLPYDTSVLLKRQTAAAATKSLKDKTFYVFVGQE
jgi:hypothetical protein